MSTAWVALALHFVERVDLDDAESVSMLVSVADAIDHAVLGVDEVTRALEDLSSRGSLEVDGRRCALVPQAKAMAEEAIEEAGSHMAISELRRRLAAHPCFIAPAAPRPDPKVFAEGVQRYVQRMNAGR